MTILIAGALFLFGIGALIVALSFPKAQKNLSVLFYRRVIAISNEIETATRNNNSGLLKTCRKRIYTDKDFQHPHAQVVKNMLLQDIEDAKEVLEKFAPKQFNFLNN